ncbi:MAG TPA: hypothetical protein VFS31_07030, partial [Chitinophagaceae bacterium]|nr:hypothetical protein [Chitinophagaceae bacterium]
MYRILLCLLLLFTLSKVFAQPRDEFLTGLYDKLHDSPMQERFRKMAPMPFGVVFLPWAGCTEADLRHHFRMMKELGFTNLKQTMATPEWPEKKILQIALEEGIIPFWYGEGGWDPITPALLTKLGIPLNTPIQEIRKNPKMLEYQHKVLYRQLEAWKTQKLPGGKSFFNEPDAYLRPDDIPAFRQWVKQHYPTIDELTKAWNQYEVGICSQPYK